MLMSRFSHAGIRRLSQDYSNAYNEIIHYASLNRIAEF